MGIPGDPVYEFELVEEGSDVTVDLFLIEDGPLDDVYLVQNTDVGLDCPSDQGVLLSSLSIPLNGMDSAVAVCNGQDVVSKSYYIFEDFDNSVGGSNVGEEVSC